MKSKEFIQEVAKRADLEPAVVQQRSAVVARLITDFLLEGDVVSIQGFGTFDVIKRKERLSVNPVTGKKWLIPPKWVPGFKPGPTLKEKIKQVKP